MSELLARVVDRAKRNTAGENVEDAAGGGKFYLASNVGDPDPICGVKTVGANGAVRRGSMRVGRSFKAQSSHSNTSAA